MHYHQLLKLLKSSTGRGKSSKDIRRLIRDFHDDLSAENESLQKKISEYNPDNYLKFFQPQSFNYAKFRWIVSQFLKQVRAKTDLLKNVDELGIKIFVEDIAIQPSFPDTPIIFNSKDVEKDNKEKSHNAGGFVKNKKGSPINILLEKPSLYFQVFFFLSIGRIEPASYGLMHELIHKYHNNLNIFNNPYLSEAQAYFNCINDMGENILEITKSLSGKLYGMDAATVKEALKIISTLYVLNMPADKIAELIAKSLESRKEIIEKVKNQKVRKKYANKFALSEYIKVLQEKMGITEREQQSLLDIYLLNGKIQRLKAQLLLYKLFDKCNLAKCK